MRALRRLTVLLAGTLLLAAADGQATIIVQQGIAGVELHMTKSQVRSLLGEPPRIRAGRNLFGPFTQFVYPRLIVEFQRVPTVTALRTSSPLERTPTGVGVGSTEAQVKPSFASCCLRNLEGPSPVHPWQGSSRPHRHDLRPQERPSLKHHRRRGAAGQITINRRGGGARKQLLLQRPLLAQAGAVDWPQKQGKSSASPGH